jgi:hypothetical protein
MSIRTAGVMTLKEWSERYGIDMREKDGAHWVPDTFTGHEARWTLWSLSDMTVSSVTGGTIWLVPRIA